MPTLTRLVMSRRPGETVVIDGGRIRVTVVSVLGNKVRLSFQAAADVVIDREEVHRKKEQQGVV